MGPGKWLPFQGLKGGFDAGLDAADENSMKKILSPKITGGGPARLAAKLRSLVAADPEIAALDGRVNVYEAWALPGGRVKVRIEMKLPDGSHRMLTRVVRFPSPPGLEVSHRGWTIVVA